MPHTVASAIPWTSAWSSKAPPTTKTYVQNHDLNLRTTQHYVDGEGRTLYTPHSVVSNTSPSKRVVKVVGADGTRLSGLSTSATVAVDAPVQYYYHNAALATTRATAVERVPSEGTVERILPDGTRVRETYQPHHHHHVLEPRYSYIDSRPVTAGTTRVVTATAPSTTTVAAAAGSTIGHDGRVVQVVRAPDTRATPVRHVVQTPSVHHRVVDAAPRVVRQDLPHHHLGSKHPHAPPAACACDPYAMMHQQMADFQQAAWWNYYAAMSMPCMGMMHQPSAAAPAMAAKAAATKHSCHCGTYNETITIVNPKQKVTVGTFERVKDTANGGTKLVEHGITSGGPNRPMTTVGAVRAEVLAK